MSKPPVVDTGAPIVEEQVRLTNIVLQALGTCDMETAVTVLTNILGHVVAEMSQGRPSEVQKVGHRVAETVKMAAIAKLLHEDDQRRAAERMNGH